jgi:hypothetical protein
MSYITPLTDLPQRNEPSSTPSAPQASKASA